MYNMFIDWKTQIYKYVINPILIYELKATAIKKSQQDFVFVWKFTSCFYNLYGNAENPRTGKSWGREKKQVGKTLPYIKT